MQTLQIKAFIIHLERATERQAQVQALAAQLPVPAQIMTAVDAKTLSDETVRQFYQPRLHKPYYPFTLSRSEIACFLSHRKVWQSMLDQNLDAALILEDDVALTADFPAVFNAACALLANSDQQDSQLIRLPFRPEKESGTLVQNYDTLSIIRPCPVGLGTIGQILNRQAAAMLLEKTRQFDRPIDTFQQMHWVTQIHPLAAIPGGVMEISADLGGSTLKQSRSWQQKLHREVMRPVYRSQVAAYSRRNTVKRIKTPQ